MSKLYSKEDVNTDKRLGCLEDAISEIFERLDQLERARKQAAKVLKRKDLPRGKAK